MDTKLQLQILLQILLGLWIQELLMEKTAAQHGGLAIQGFGTSISDANMMFEFLLGGVEIDQDNNIRLLDQEMASLRQGRAFLAVVNDKVPKTLPSMDRMLTVLEDQKGPLSPAHFESLVMGVVYTAHQTRRQKREEQQLAWGGVLTRLANIIVDELHRDSP